MHWTLYLSILPIGLGIMTLVGSLICLVGYLTSVPEDSDNRRLLWPWFIRLLLIAFLLLSMGLFLTYQQFQSI